MTQEITKMTFNDLISIANKGNTIAHFELGWRYYHGIGIKKRNKKAFYRWKIAENQGHIDSSLKLSRMCRDGECYCEEDLHYMSYKNGPTYGLEED